MAGADDLPTVSADLMRRIADLERGRMEMNTAVALVTQSVVDIKETLHDIRGDMEGLRDDFSVYRQSSTADAKAILAEAHEAASQARITNGRVTEIERWKKQHEAAVEPIIAKAVPAFEELKALRVWRDGQERIYAEQHAVQRFVRALGRNIWLTLLALIGAVSSLIALAFAMDELFARFG